MAQDYTAQLNQARAWDKKNLGSIQSAAVNKLAGYIVERMTKAVNDKQSWVWPFAFFLAILNDGSDILISWIPFIGGAVQILTAIILTAFLWNIGGFIKWKIRIVLWIAGSLESLASITVVLALIGFLPLYTLSIVYAHHVVQKKGEIAEEGLKRLKKGEVYREAVKEFR